VIILPIPLSFTSCSGFILHVLFAEQGNSVIVFDRTRGNGFKLKEGIFKVNIRKKFFTLRVVRHRHRLPREAVAACSLALFKAKLDGTLSNVV